MKALTLVLGVLLVSAAGAAAGGDAVFPSRIALPNGFQPEGIATTAEQFYVGSIPTGAVYRGSLRTGKGAVLVSPQSGRAAIGIDADRGRLFVAGGPTGKAFVYDARNGRSIAALELAPQGASTFVNDVVVTRRAAWFTDSSGGALYRLPLGANGRPGAQAAVTELKLTGDFQLQQGFNANGIDATADGAALVIVQSNTGRLFRVDPRTGVARRIDLGSESVPNGDGILLDGLTLYVVQNQLNVVAKIALRSGLRSGRVVRRVGKPPFDLDVPTTIDELGPRLYTVNARFNTTPTSATAYWVTRLPK
jgi:sugar lactone lactonase YvrE